MIRPKDSYGCGGCDTRWGGQRTAHCGTCHSTFSGPTAFDEHRDWVRGICRDLPGTRLVKIQRAGYVVWGKPGDEALILRLRPEDMP